MHLRLLILWALVLHPPLASANSVLLTITGRVEVATDPYTYFGDYVVKEDALGPVAAVLYDPNSRIGGLPPSLETVTGELQSFRTDDDLPVILITSRLAGTRHGRQDATWSRTISPDGVHPLRSIPSISRRLLTAASATPPGEFDTDNDGVPDQYEITVGSDPNTPDSGVDHDFDGVTLLNEYLAGTLDNDPLSLLDITSITPAAGGWTITWQSVPGKSYRLLATRDFSSALAPVSGANLTATSTTSSLTISWPSSPMSTFFAIEVLTTP